MHNDKVFVPGESGNMASSQGGGTQTDCERNNATPYEWHKCHCK